MKWPWTRERTNHATLTLLADGSAIIGWPPGSLDDENAAFADAVEEWLAVPDGHKMLFAPWPIDVTDLRGPAS